MYLFPKLFYLTAYMLSIHMIIMFSKPSSFVNMLNSTGTFGIPLIFFFQLDMVHSIVHSLSTFVPFNCSANGSKVHPILYYLTRIMQTYIECFVEFKSTVHHILAVNSPGYSV